MLHHILDSCRCRSCACDSPIGRSPWKALAVFLSMLVLTCGCQKQPATAVKDEKPRQVQAPPKEALPSMEETEWDKMRWEENKEYWKIRSEAPPLTVVRILSPFSLLGKWGGQYYVFVGTDESFYHGDASGFVVNDARPEETAERILSYSQLEYFDLKTRTGGVHPRKSAADDKAAYPGTFYMLNPFPGGRTFAPPPIIVGFYLDLSAPLEISAQEAKDLERWDELPWGENWEIRKIRRQAPPLIVVRILSPSSLLGKWGGQYYVFVGTNEYVNQAGERTGNVANDASPLETVWRLLSYSQLEYFDLKTRTKGIHPRRTAAFVKEAYPGPFHVFLFPSKIVGFYFDLSAPLDISAQEAKELGVDRQVSK